MPNSTRAWLLAFSLLVPPVAVAASDAPSEADRLRARPESTLQLGSKIGIVDRTYLVINAFDAIARIPHPTVKMINGLLRQCRATRAYGFAATRPVDVGVVAWVPTNVLDCWLAGDDVTVVGGGPAEPARPAPCLQGFRTPDRRLYVIFAGSSYRVCSHMATQAPGAVYGVTTQSADGVSAGVRLPVKCQSFAGGELWNFMATYANALPASKSAWWIRDRFVDTGYRDWIPGIPSCSGMRFQW